jgi:DNA-binding NarL/FixJ family response regulator
MVLAVDDHQSARAWLCAAINDAFPDAQVRQANNARAAIEIADAQMLDLALLDIGLPDASGLEVLKFIRQKWPQCVVIVATVFDDDEHLFAALRLGAQGYLLKEQARHSLADSLSGILQGQPALSAGIARRLMAHFNAPIEPARLPTQLDRDVTTLTMREREVLQLVAKGCNVPEAASMLGISPNTTQGYVKEVYRKLAVSSRAEAALMANRMGLV